MVPVLTACVGTTRAAATVLDASGIHTGVQFVCGSVYQTAVAAGAEQHEDYCPTHTNETRAFGFGADSRTAFATRGPAASHAVCVEKPGTLPRARTSPGTTRNQTTNVHMGAS